MKKVTREQLDDVYYRSLLLSDKMEELEGIIDGTGTSLLPMITDENGISVSEKVDALAAELLESYRHYLELNNREPEGWEEEMYSCFLYCAMQMYQENINRYDAFMTYTDIPGTYGAILDAAKSVIADKQKFKSFRDFFTEFYTAHREGRRIKLSDFCINGNKALKELGFSEWYDEVMIFDPPRDLHKELCEKFTREHKADEDSKRAEQSDDDELWIYELPKYMQREIQFENSVYKKLVKNNEGVDVNDRDRWLAEDPDGCIKAFKDAKREVIEENRAWWDEEDHWEDVAYEALHGDEDRERERQKAKLKELGRRNSFKEYDKHDEFRGFYIEDIYELWKSIDFDNQHKSRENWRGFVADKDILQKRFARFIQLYYDHDCSGFYDNVQNMVLSYLIENRLCPMGLGDDYGLVTHKLKIAMMNISNEIERVKNK